MTTITINRATVEQALEALERADKISGYANNKKVITALKAALAQQAEPVEPVAWLRVIDEAMVTHHLGVADPADDYETAKRKMNNLLCTAQDIGTFFAKTEPVQEPVEPVAEARYDGTLRWLEPHGVGLHRIQGPLYTAPPQRKPLPTHDQHCVDVPGYGLMAVRLVRAVERAHGIGEGA